MIPPDENLASWRIEGPWRWITAIGVRLSVRQHDLTFGGTDRGGVRVDFREPVSQLGVRVPALDLTVDDLEGFAAALAECGLPGTDTRRAARPAHSAMPRAGQDDAMGRTQLTGTLRQSFRDASIVARSDARGRPPTLGVPGNMASTTRAGGDAMDRSGRGRWIGLAMLSIGVAMIIVDVTIVNVAIPSIIRELNLDSTQAEWINTIYALVFAALLITLGRLGDVLGRRRMYLTGLLVFIGASMLAGLSPSGGVLILARMLQGVGGAMILPSTQAILNANFQGRDRAIAFGIWGSVIGGMAAVGPLLGGFLTTYLSWRWAFFINLPIGLLAVWGTRRYIGESKDPEARRGFDLPGFALITAGLGAVIYGLIEGRQYGWWTPNPRHPFEIAGWTWPFTQISVIPFILAFGVLALVIFGIVETRRRNAGKFFLFDFTLWRYRGFRYGNLAGTIVSLGEFGLLFALPLFLQGVLGYTAFETGLVFLSLAIGAFVAAPLAATFARRYGPRWVVTTGMLLEAVGILAVTLLISTTLDGLMLFIPLFVYGIGVGFATAQLTSIVLSDVPIERSGIASGANSTLRQVGSALGIAILGTVLFSVLVNQSSDQFASVPPPAGLPPAVATQIGDFVATALDESAGQAIGPLRDDPATVTAYVDLPPAVSGFLTSPVAKSALAPYVAIAEQSFVDATKAAGFVATGFVILGVIFSLRLPQTKPRTTGQRDAEPAGAAAAGSA